MPEVPDALLPLGFGSVEIGTVTPLPQPGNPRPRLFRLPARRGVINRLGFNSEGADAGVAAARRARGRGRASSASMSAPTRTQGSHRGLCEADRDVRAGRELFTCNISSPNTPGLRDLQQAGCSTSCSRA